MGPEFDILNGIAIDNMHGILLGIVKTLILLWFDLAQHRGRQNATYPNYFIGNMVRLLFDIIFWMLSIDEKGEIQYLFA